MVLDAESYQPHWISESPSTGYDKDRRQVWVPGCQSEAEDVAKVAYCRDTTQIGRSHWTLQAGMRLASE